MQRRRRRHRVQRVRQCAPNLLLIVDACHSGNLLAASDPRLGPLNERSFAQLAFEKMLTYALGRGVEYPDMPTLRSIVRDSAGSKYKFSSIVMAIVKSDAFQMNQKAAASGQGPVASR